MSVTETRRRRVRVEGPHGVVGTEKHVVAGPGPAGRGKESLRSKRALVTGKMFLTECQEPFGDVTVSG